MILPPDLKITKLHVRIREKKYPTAPLSFNHPPLYFLSLIDDFITRRRPSITNGKRREDKAKGMLRDLNIGPFAGLLSSGSADLGLVIPLRLDPGSTA